MGHDIDQVLYRMNEAEVDAESVKRRDLREQNAKDRGLQKS
jgi:hypothetical protein